MTRSILVVFALASLVSVTGADSLAPRGAEGITQADVSVLIGGGLDRESPTSLQLFCGKAERASRFEAALRAAMSRSLRSKGIAVVPGSKSGFGVALYGRPVERNCSGRHAVLIEFAVSNDRYPDADQPVAQRGVLETPTGPKLEADIEARVLMLLDEALQNRPN